MFHENAGNLKEPLWKQIESKALDLGKMRLYRLVQGADLFAREAKFHQSCLSSFKLEHLAHVRAKSKDAESASESKLDPDKTAHMKAFGVVLHFISEHVIAQKEVVLLTTLHKIYLQELQIMGVVNPVYTSRNLKNRLENHEISAHIAFTNVDPGNEGCRSYNLIYNASLSVSEAVAHAYQLGSKDSLMETARLLRGIIQKAFADATPLPWPPTADDLAQSPQEQLPQDLLMFLNFVVTGNTPVAKHLN